MKIPSDQLRIEGAESDHAKWMRAVRIVQQYGLDELGRFFDELKTDEQNRIEAGAKNYRKLSGVSGLFERIKARLKSVLLPLFIDAVDAATDRNDRYLANLDYEPKEDVRTRAVRMALLRYGYDNKAGKLIEGGYLDSLFSSKEVGSRVAGYVNQAIAAKMPIAQFRAIFGRVFVGKPGAGMLEKHFETRTFDLFQAVDRAIHRQLAIDGGFTHFLYSGTVMKHTRPFCETRAQKPFSEKEIEAWRDLEWQGKIEIGYDPWLDCGGYNCRHHLSAISPQLYEHLKK